MQGLLIIDMQNDFLPGGALPVPHGEEIIPLLSPLLHSSHFQLKIASKDVHPPNHISFASRHHLPVGEIWHYDGQEQLLWPDHCIEGTWGAEFAPGWESMLLDHVVYKGREKEIDSYSAFFDNGRWHATGLDSYLKAEGIHILFLVGVATDYCVKYSALDAVRLGFKVFIIPEACRAVNHAAGDEEKAYEEMQQQGVELIPLASLLSRNVP